MKENEVKVKEQYSNNWVPVEVEVTKISKDIVEFFYVKDDENLDNCTLKGQHDSLSMKDFCHYYSQII
jgi:hypothetical protein